MSPGNKVYPERDALLRFIKSELQPFYNRGDIDRDEFVNITKTVLNSNNVYTLEDPFALFSAPGQKDVLAWELDVMNRLMVEILNSTTKRLGKKNIEKNKPLESPTLFKGELNTGSSYIQPSPRKTPSKTIKQDPKTVLPKFLSDAIEARVQQLSSQGNMGIHVQLSPRSMTSHILQEMKKFKQWGVRPTSLNPTSIKSLDRLSPSTPVSIERRPNILQQHHTTSTSDRTPSSPFTSDGIPSRPHTPSCHHSILSNSICDNRTSSLNNPKDDFESIYKSRDTLHSDTAQQILEQQLKLQALLENQQKLLQCNTTTKRRSPSSKRRSKFKSSPRSSPYSSSGSDHETDYSYQYQTIQSQLKTNDNPTKTIINQPVDIIQKPTHQNLISPTSTIDHKLQLTTKLNNSDLHNDKSAFTSKIEIPNPKEDIISTKLDKTTAYSSPRIRPLLTESTIFNNEPPPFNSIQRPIITSLPQKHTPLVPPTDTKPTMDPKPRKDSSGSSPTFAFYSSPKFNLNPNITTQQPTTISARSTPFDVSPDSQETGLSYSLTTSAPNSRTITTPSPPPPLTSLDNSTLKQSQVTVTNIPYNEKIAQFLAIQRATLPAYLPSCTSTTSSVPSPEKDILESETDTATSHKMEWIKTQQNYINGGLEPVPDPSIPTNFERTYSPSPPCGPILPKSCRSSPSMSLRPQLSINSRHSPSELSPPSPSLCTNLIPNSLSPSSSYQSITPSYSHSPATISTRVSPIMDSLGMASTSRYPPRDAVIEYIRDMLQPLYNSGQVSRDTFVSVIRTISVELFSKQWPCGQDHLWKDFLRNNIYNLLEFQSTSSSPLSTES